MAVSKVALAPAVVPIVLSFHNEAILLHQVAVTSVGRSFSPITQVS